MVDNWIEQSERIKTALEKTSSEIQQDCHRSVENIMKKVNDPNMNIQDATNAWLFRKLAEMQLEINALKSRGRIRG